LLSWTLWLSLNLLSYLSLSYRSRLERTELSRLLLTNLAELNLLGRLLERLYNLLGLLTLLELGVCSTHKK